MLINNHIISSTGESTLNINMGAYLAGSYRVLLVIDGNIVDIKNLIKQ